MQLFVIPAKKRTIVLIQLFSNSFWVYCVGWETEVLSSIVTEPFFPEMDCNSGSRDTCEDSPECCVKNLVLTVYQV